MSPEEIDTHGQPKNVITTTLTALVMVSGSGRFYPDRTWLTNEEVGLSTEPDGIFVSRETRRSGRVRRVRGTSGIIRLEGTADMVLEIISRSSQHKDPVVLRQLYWEAGVLEYWLVDARKEPLRFDILRHTPKGYVAVRKQGGWVKSAVFGKSFKLTVAPDEFGDPEYTLSVR
jgi:Uma2 family endonuclease